MSAQQKYLYQYAYLGKSSFNVIENNNLYNDDRGNAEVLQNYNHNSLNLSFKAGEHTAKALSVLLASSEVGLILEPVTHADLVNENIDVYDLVKIGNINMTPNFHFYEVAGEYLSNQINNIDFLTRRIIPVATGEEESDIMFVTINDGTNDYFVNTDILTSGITSFYYPTGEEVGAPLALIDLRNMTDFSINFGNNIIPANFLSGFVNTPCEMTITNAISIMSIGDNAFANSEFANIVANFSGIRELGGGVKLAKTGGTVTTQNPLGLIAYDDLSIVLTNDVQEIDSLIIASDFFASGSQKILNDTCNALSHFCGTLTEIKNCTIVEDFADITNLDFSDVIFDNCTFAVNQDFSGNPETRILTIRNCNQENAGAQEFTFTGFSGSIIIENSFKSATAEYDVDDAAAYALEIDNNSFINAGADSGSLNKVLTNENRSLPPIGTTAGAFLRVDGYNIVSFSGVSFLTVGAQILTITEITTIVFSDNRPWDLMKGNFNFAGFAITSHLYLYDPSTKNSRIYKFIPNSFNLFTQVAGNAVLFAILASQILEILAVNNCFNSNETIDTVNIYNDLPSDFNYLEIARNNSSFIFAKLGDMAFSNDPDDLLRSAMTREYPEYPML